MINLANSKDTICTDKALIYRQCQALASGKSLDEGWMAYALFYCEDLIATAIIADGWGNMYSCEVYIGGYGASSEEALRETGKKIAENDRDTARHITHKDYIALLAKSLVYETSL